MEKKQNVPALRFQGFSGEWKDSILSNEVSSIDTGRSHFRNDSTGNFAILGSTSVIGYDNSFDYEGDFLLVARVGNAGSLYRYSGKVKISDNTVFIQGTDLDFLFYELTHIDLKKLSFGTGQPLVKASTLRNLKISLPSDNEETKRLGCLLTNFDKVINSQHKKCVSLKRFRQAMLTKLFPREGAAEPELRFRGFSGKWEQCTAKKIFESKDDRNHPDLPVLTATQEYGMVRRDRINYNVGHDKRNEVGYKRVLPGQFVIHLRSFQGGFAHSPLEGIISPAYTVMAFRDEEKHDEYFWKYVFLSESFINRLSTVTYGIRDGRSISFEDFGGLQLCFPSKEEQAKIGAVLRKIDSFISLQQKKLERMQRLKAALLEKLFV